MEICICSGVTLVWFLTSVKRTGTALQLMKSNCGGGPDVSEKDRLGFQVIRSDVRAGPDVSEEDGLGSTVDPE